MTVNATVLTINRSLLAGGSGGGAGDDALGGAGGAGTLSLRNSASLFVAETLQIGGVGGTGGSFDLGVGGAGGNGSVTVDGSSIHIGASGRLIVGGAGGDTGGLPDLWFGGNGGAGTLSLRNSAFLFVADTLQIGGDSIGRFIVSVGGTGGNGSVTVDGSSSIHIGASGRLIIGGARGVLPVWTGGMGGVGTLNLGGSLDFASGATLVINENGTLNFGNATPGAAPAGSITGLSSLTNDGAINFNQSNTTYVFSPAMTGRGSLNQNGSGATILSGLSSYTGATMVNGGALIVNGSIAASSGVTVAAGATLGGSGSLRSTVINGGTLSPGNSPGTMTINGNLTLNPGSVYLAEVQGANADRVNVTGTASLAGTLRIVPLGGNYLFNSAYTLLSAAGGRNGTFSPVDTIGSFGAGVSTTVSYTANDVLLTLAPKPLVPTLPPASPTLGVIAPRNAYAVATAVDGAVDNGGDPSSMFGLYNLPAAAIQAAVNSLSGEVHTAARALASIVSDQFLRTMLDPAATGRLGMSAEGPGTAAYSGLGARGADQPAGASRFDRPFYSVWGSAYGSSGRTDGSAAIGSARRRIDDAHLATGIDIRLMPGLLAGVAISGGKAQASLPGLTGKVDADVFQAGLYGLAQFGPARIGGALSYARLENEVSRGIPALGSSLSSAYATTAWSGRLQASAAVLAWNGLSVSSLAAIQATRAQSPAVAEANWAGASAGALALARRDDVTARGELGVQVDSDMMLGGVPVTGHVRAAWAHYVRRDADLTASLVGLPRALFTATGAVPDRNSALVNVGVTARLGERMTLGLGFDGEFSGNSNRLGGSAQLRVSF